MQPSSGKASVLARSLLCAAVLLSLFTSASAQMRRPAHGIPDGQASTVTTVKTPFGSRALRAVAHAKLTSKLAQLANSVPQMSLAEEAQANTVRPSFSVSTLPSPVQALMSTGHMRINARNEVQVYVEVDAVNDSALQALRGAGATVQLSDAKRGVIQAAVPVNVLQSLAAQPFVRLVDLPVYGHVNAGSVSSAGDTIVKADQVRSKLKVTGKNVRVGIISDGIAGIFATDCTACTALTTGPIGTKDLPDATATRDANGVLIAADGGIVAKSFRSDANLEGGLGVATGAEGTAIMEIVHDLAPDAQLYFANFQTSLEFNAATDWLAVNSDVVADDIGFFSPPYDGTSIVSAGPAASLNKDTNSARALITSVGNSADTHYLGMFTPSSSDGAGFTGVPGKLHVFQANSKTTDYCAMGRSVADVVVVPPGGVFIARINWDDPWNAARNDYDAYLFYDTGSGLALVDSSTNVQAGGASDHPYELLAVQNTGSDDAQLYVMVQNKNDAAAPKNINIFYQGSYSLDCGQTTGLYPNHTFNTVSSSLMAHSDAGGTPVSVVAVGAIDASDPGNVDIEPFSSQGPTVDGRMKPDITAIDGVAVTGAGGFMKTFYGTSAASPHTAAVAALMLQASPCLQAGATGARTPADARSVLRNGLTANAFDLGDGGADNVFGYGRVDALASVSSFVPTAATTGDKTVSATSNNGAAVTFDGSASTDPNSCPLTYTWSGGCGSGTGAKPSLNCPIGANTVTLTVSNNGVTTSTATSTVKVTDFTLSATTPSATVKRGESAQYTVNIAPVGGSFDRQVTFSCFGAPANTTCSAAPAITPGANGGNLTVTVTTTAPGKPGPDQLASNHNGRTSTFAFWTFSLMAVGLVGIRLPKKFFVTIVLVAVLASLFVTVGCGNGSDLTRKYPGTPVGHYQVTVIGQSNSLEHSVMMDLVIQ